ncbi:hypothetical protein GF357_03020 [Candidatus Dojkabacteria bacterium]|nr:hypothetical protein [Candidatus Dojkabacteria bacterium]
MSLLAREATLSFLKFSDSSKLLLNQIHRMTNLLKNLATTEVLGINRRNQDYLRPLNSPSAKKIADSKLLTKRILRRSNIQTPELFKVIRTEKQLKYVDWSSLPKSFVIKPNQGSRGRGILIVYGKKKGSEQAWIQSNNQIVRIKDFESHIMQIFEGRFSLGSRRDIALIEERLKTDKLLKKYSYKGVPDIRIIVYNSIPLMAMTRLPTKESNGKANLHAGAICVGIDIGSGITINGIHLKSKSLLSDTYEPIEMTYDQKINLPIKGIEIPNWDEILEIAVKCQRESGLGYAGVDIAIDRDKGPMVFELNARPGLGIQVTNNAGLRFRLERVAGIKVKNTKHAVRIAKNLFGGSVSEEIELLSGRQIANLVEKITLFEKGKYKVKRKRKKLKQGTLLVKGLLDTGLLTSRIDRDTAAKLGFIDAIKSFNSYEIPKVFNSFEEAQAYIDKMDNTISKHEDIVRLAKITEEGKIRVRPVISVNLLIKGIHKNIEVIISTRKELIYPILIGRRELKDFLIDASKTFTR